MISYAREYTIVGRYLVGTLADRTDHGEFWALYDITQARFFYARKKWSFT